MSKDKQPKDPAEQGKEIKTAADLKQDGNNYRKHSDTNKARIKKSIDEAGLGRSVVIDADGVLVAGNGVQQVVDKDTPVRVVETDGTELVVVKRTDLHTGDPRRKTLALADNATSDDVEWDFEAIAEDWTEDEAGEWGVEWPADEEEIEQKEAQIEQKEAQEDDFDPDAHYETKVKAGDIWKLGNHRLMCGDSTDANAVTKLMNGEKADLWLTDPPYNVDYNAKNEYLNKMGKGGAVQVDIENDKMSDADFDQFLRNAFGAAQSVMKEGASYYVWTAQGHALTDISKALDAIGMSFRQQLIWVKNNFVIGRSDYQLKHEPCFYGWKAGAAHNWHSDRSQTTVLNFDKPLKSDLHPTMKPVPLFGYQVGNSTKEGEIVIDTFGGSGTTMIACEQLGRKCFMMELDPHYCDVIIARWEKLTGNKAEKLK